MSHIETITNDLQAIAAGIDRAQTSTSAVDRQAQEVTARAARSGFTGIATGMSQVRQAIAEARTSLATTNGLLQEAATPVTAAPKEMSPQQTIDLLSPATEKITSVHGGVSATISKLSDAQRLAAAALQGGQPGPIVTALQSIKQILSQVTQRCEAAKQHITAATGEARQIGESAGN